jgi:hypothetical protein
LTVGADIALPGVTSTSPVEGFVDVHVRLRPTPPTLDGARAVGTTCESDGRRLLCRLPGIGRFLSSDGNTLDIEPDAGVSPSDLLPLALGTGWAALLHQRGRFPLRGAAVAVRGQAVIICGGGGAGKSTLAAALAQSGSTVLCDDVAAIGVDSGAPVLWPERRCLQLADPALDQLQLWADATGEVRPGTGKHYVRTADIGEWMPRLGAIYVLQDAVAPAPAPVLERLPPLAAAQILLAHAYRRRLALDSARAADWLAITAAIVGHVPVSVLSRPRGLSRLGETAAFVLAQVR